MPVKMPEQRKGMLEQSLQMVQAVKAAMDTKNMMSGGKDAAATPGTPGTSAAASPPGPTTQVPTAAPTVTPSSKLTSDNSTPIKRRINYGGMA